MGVTLPPPPPPAGRFKRLYKVNSVVPSVTRVVNRKYAEVSATAFPAAEAFLASAPATMLWNADVMGKQPFLRSETSRSGLRDHSPFKLSARLSRTKAGAVQRLILMPVPGRAVT